VYDAPLDGALGEQNPLEHQDVDFGDGAPGTAGDQGAASIQVGHPMAA
jgi:hypothetical protein